MDSVCMGLDDSDCAKTDEPCVTVNDCCSTSSHKCKNKKCAKVSDDDKDLDSQLEDDVYTTCAKTNKPCTTVVDCCHTDSHKCSKGKCKKIASDPDASDIIEDLLDFFLQ